MKIAIMLGVAIVLTGCVSTLPLKDSESPVKPFCTTVNGFNTPCPTGNEMVCTNGKGDRVSCKSGMLVK